MIKQNKNKHIIYSRIIKEIERIKLINENIICYIKMVLIKFLLYNLFKNIILYIFFLFIKGFK